MMYPWCTIRDRKSLICCKTNTQVRQDDARKALSMANRRAEGCRYRNGEPEVGIAVRVECAPRFFLAIPIATCLGVQETTT